jgi:hypothetical protein
MITTSQVGTPKRRAENRWFVRSGTAGVGYTVARVQDASGDWRWRCTCPSFRWRQTTLPGGRCKHISACLEWLRQQRKAVRMG